MTFFRRVHYARKFFYKTRPGIRVNFTQIQKLVHDDMTVNKNFYTLANKTNYRTTLSMCIYAIVKINSTKVNL